MLKKLKKRITDKAIENAIAASFFVLIIAGVVGWLVNIYKLAGALWEHRGWEALARLFGACAPPIGALLGFV